MSIKKYLFADLERQYYYDGIKEKNVTIVGLVKRSFNPRFTPILLYRISHYLFIKDLVPIAKLVSLINFVIFGIEIGLRCEIGEGLYLPHTVGTVIGANRIGQNAVIFQGVTVGAKELDLGYHKNKRPNIGDRVVIGAGAKVLGGIQIGDGVTIGANAVVTKSLPANVVAAGIPACIIREVKQEQDNA